MILIGLMVSCGGSISYWTYTVHKPSNHVTHPPYIPVWIDSTFTGEQAEEIRAAIKEWNYVLNGQIVIYLVEKKGLGTDKKMHNYPDSFLTWEAGHSLQEQCEKTGLGWVIYNLPSTNPHLDKEVGEGALAFVTGTDEHSVTVISDRFGGRSMKDVVMHEFAHLLGARHLNAPSLEYPYYSSKQYPCIDKITVAQVAEERNLNLDDLNYCITPHFE
jgi:hypothetical protein